MKTLYLEKSIGIEFQKGIVIIVLLGKTFKGVELLDYRIWRNSSNGQEDTIKQLIEDLNDFKKKNELKAIRGAFCIPRQDFFLKYIDVPTPKIENIKNILEFEIERHVPLKKEDFYYDFQVISKKDENLYNILIAVSKKSQVDHYIHILKEASIIPSLVSLSAVSNFILLSIIDYNREILNAIIEIGVMSVNISFIHSGSMNFTRSIPMPGNHDWKKFLWEKFLSNAELETAANDFAEFLIKEINLSLAGFRDISSEQTVDCIYLSGGGSLAFPLKNNLEAKIKGTVHILNPLTVLRNKNNNITEKDKSLLTNAIGTGVQNHIKNDFEINLLPKSLEKHARDNSLKAMLIFSGILTLALMITFFSGFFKNHITLNKIENELKKIKKEVIMAENLEREYEKIDRQKLVLQKIEQNNPSRLNILKELSTLLPPDVWLLNLIIKQDAAEIMGTAGSTSKLVPLLEKSELFTDVHFIGSITHVKNREQFKIKLPLKKVIAK